MNDLAKPQGNADHGGNSFFKQFMIVIWMFLMLAVMGGIYITVDKSTLSLASNINVTIGLMTLAGLTMLCLVVSMDRTPRTAIADLFYLLIVLCYFGVFSDNMSWLVDGKPQYRALGYVLDALSYLVQPFYCVVFYVYQNQLLPERKYNRPILRAIIALAVLDALFILLGTFSGTLFTLDEYTRYSAGDYDWIAILFPLVVVAICIYNNLSSSIPLRKRIALLALVLTPLSSAFISLLFPDLAIVYVVAFFMLMLVYGTVQMERSIKHAKQAKELLEKQTEIMISQIQPHFLYNTLSVISFLCEEDGMLAQEAVEKFALYLRTNMDSLQSKTPVPFAKELEHTKTYLWIEKMRFGDILNVEYDIQYDGFELPPLTLQPIVENAVKHGVRSRDEGGTITISTRRDGKDVLISVADDGMGFDPKTAYNDGRVHIGIDNARNRLALLCNGHLQIDSTPGVGTTVTIRLEGKA